MHQQKENREIVEKALERGYRGEDTLESLLYSLATGDKKNRNELDQVAERTFNLHRAITIRDMGTKEMRTRHDTIREDSDRYPRPTPLDVFKEPPFDLSQEEILSCLEEMSNREEYQDLSQVSTSIGHVFLYSSRYLDRDYALMLAEWIDVGQFENP
jgi:hypothetical protein